MTNDVDSLRSANAFDQLLAEEWEFWRQPGNERAMHAGTPAQEAEVRRQAFLHAVVFPDHVLEISRSFRVPRFQIFRVAEHYGTEPSMFRVECLWLRESGLYEAPIPPGVIGGFPDQQDSYRYGSAWLRYDPETDPLRL